MTGTAKRVLVQALENNAHLPQDPNGWDHFYTAVGDDRVGVFMFDHDRTGVSLKVLCGQGGRQTVEMNRR